MLLRIAFPEAPASFSHDCHTVLRALDALSCTGLDFHRCQFQCWDWSAEEPVLLLISVQREQVLHSKEAGYAEQLTGEVVAWDFEAERWNHQQPLLRFFSFDALHAWLLCRSIMPWTPRSITQT
jgi:hypothetical protein